MFRPIIALAIDLALTLCALILALALRENMELPPAKVYAALSYYVTALVVAGPIFMICGLHKTIWRLSALPDYLQILYAVGATVIATVAIVFTVDRLDGVSRSLPVLHALLMATLLIGGRLIARRHYERRLARTGRPPPTALAPEQALTAQRAVVLVVGLNRLTELYLQTAAEFGGQSVTIAGLIGRSDRHTGRLVQQYPVLGTPDDIAGILKTLELHGVFVNRIVIMTALADLSPSAREAILEVEKTTETRIEVFSDYLGLTASPLPCQPASVTPSGPSREPAKVATFVLGPERLARLSRRTYWRAKRAIDIVVAAVVIATILVAIDLGWPIVFWQQRPGRGGRTFRVYKLRTMAPKYSVNGLLQPDHQRTSAIGHMLRRTRLDELPQLFNVLSGEMSFIGPRPLLPIDQPLEYRARLLVRPGLTGWAQVMGGREISAADKAALDVWYVQNASLKLDLEIIARTASVVVWGERVDARAVRRAWNDLSVLGICAAPAVSVEG
jgi:lipopolysaccharide/colanic/teichoic acid biosynthesis glycosyltransferase